MVPEDPLDTTIGRHQDDAMNHAISLDRDRIRNHADPVRWASQALLLVLVSPALVAVLAVGGLAIGTHKVASAAGRAYATLRPQPQALQAAEPQTTSV